MNIWKHKKHRKTREEQCDLQFTDFRDNDGEEKNQHINKELNKLRILKKIQKQNIIYVMMDFDATSLDPSAMWDEKSVCPKTESGFLCKPHVNNIYVEAFNNQSFDKHGNESAILKIIYYHPLDLIFQHLPILKKGKNVEVNSKRNGHIMDTLTSVDICEILKLGGKVMEIYDVVFYRKNFKISPSRKI